LLALLCWRNMQNRYAGIYFSAMVLGLAGGVRQNTLLFMLPLWILSLSRAGHRRCLLSLGVLVVTVGSWYLPMARLSGGIAAYQSALRDHWLNSNWHGFGLEWIPFNFFCVSYFILLGTGPGALFLVLAGLFYFEKAQFKSLSMDPKVQFFAAWLLPSLGFFLLIYSHPIQTGHSLIYLPALIILLPGSVLVCCEQLINLFGSSRGSISAHQMSTWGDGVRLGSSPTRPWSQIILMILPACNLFMFLGMNSAVSHAAIRRYESQVREIMTKVISHWSPQEVVLVSYDFMFLGFRDFMFHLPGYHCYQPKLYSLAGKQLLFAGFRRQTSLVEQIEVPSGAKWFVLNADEFIRNPALIQGCRLDKLSQDAFLITPSGFRLFRGEMQDLPRFFPQVHIKFR